MIANSCRSLIGERVYAISGVKNQCSTFYRVRLSASVFGRRLYNPNAKETRNGDGQSQADPATAQRP
jgi:hypothetical protein